MINKAVFLDRDGVINKNRDDLVKNWKEFKFLPGVTEAIKLLTIAGYLILIISNQDVVGKKIITNRELDLIHSKMNKVIEKKGGKISGIYCCVHDPQISCSCRKPNIGLFKKAAKDHGFGPKDCVFIGDKITDVIAGKKYGCKTILLTTTHTLDELEKEWKD